MTPDSTSEGRILFENEACAVINKLTGESSEFPWPERNGPAELFPVHRLDQPVTGCLLLAKTQDAAAFLGEVFARSAGAEKRYWAIIEKPEKEIPSEAELVHWLCENKNLNKSFAVSAPAEAEGSATASAAASAAGAHSKRTSRPGKARGGSGRPKKAVLRYRLAGTGDHYLFMEIDLITGRHHQIRAQLAAVGLHVKGDLKYGARRSEKAGGIRLHAYSLVFPNPLNPAERIEVKALPPGMDVLWKAFVDQRMNIF